jgi:DNA polymerase-3 subunit epsilon
MRQVVLDTETTGLSPLHGHRLTEIGCLEIINRKITNRSFQTYLNPDRELDDKAAEITGLSWSMLKDKPRFAEKVDELLEFIDGAELIIHNAPFDLGFLDHELSLIKHPWGKISQKLGVIDTLILSREMHPGQRNSLDALCKRYNIDNSHRTRHGALLDAEILAGVYLAMTAGQTDLDLMTQTILTQTVRVDNSASSSVQARGVDLKIIYASEQERTDHAAMLALIEKQKR